MNKGKTITLAHIDPKYHPPRPVGPDGKEILVSEDPHTTAFNLRYAINSMKSEEDDKLYRKQKEENDRIQAEHDEQNRKQNEYNQQRPRKSLAERQYDMLMSGKYPRYNLGPTFGNHPIFMRPAMVGSPPKMYYEQGAPITIDDLQPGISYMAREITTLKQEINSGEIIKRLVGERAYNRLVEFANDGESWDDLMNRLLDFVTSEAQRGKSETLQMKKTTTQN